MDKKEHEDLLSDALVEAKNRIEHRAISEAKDKTLRTIASLRNKWKIESLTMERVKDRRKSATRVDAAEQIKARVSQMFDEILTGIPSGDDFEN